MPVVSLVFRRFAGESIVAWGVRLVWRADDDLGKINNWPCLQCLHYDLISLRQCGRTSRLSQLAPWSVSQQVQDLGCGGLYIKSAVTLPEHFLHLLHIDNLCWFRPPGA
jgi:hypothetical protein